MRIAIIGMWKWEIYESAFLRGLAPHVNELICTKTTFGINGRLLGRLFRVPFFSPFTVLSNLYIVIYMVVARPDCCFFWRPTTIFPETIKILNALGILTCSYNNDNPFTKVRKGYDFWRLYKKCLPLFKLNFFYRESNLLQAKALNIDGFLMRSWYDPQIHYVSQPISARDAEIVFVGHFENDKRVQFLKAVINHGFKISIYGGTSWSMQEASFARNYLDAGLARLNPTDYHRVLNNAKIGLAFYSELNQDSYTRRCFEIPACGAVLVAFRTPVMMELFTDRKNAYLFDSIEELTSILTLLLSNESLRRSVAEQGQAHVRESGYDLYSVSYSAYSKINSLMTDADFHAKNLSN